MNTLFLLLVLSQPVTPDEIDGLIRLGWYKEAAELIKDPVQVTPLSDLKGFEWIAWDPTGSGY